ncbi:uncharacterized protein (DUF2336 family) [Rhizobium sp. BK251]|nr:uncharacterized protein (DUF2336 family) [Rhizobium sp. BK251]
MATVSSFEGIAYPSKSQLRQFAELFTPLFQASTDEAKRQAVAALSQCPHVPPAVALFIGSQPIEIAAPFLAGPQAIDDEVLITIARTQGAAHARAIVSRDSLSPKVIDALVGINQAELRRVAAGEPEMESPAMTPAPSPARDEAEALRLANEETLRRRIKQIAHQLAEHDDDRLGLRSLSDVQSALLVRFARLRDATQFSVALADALSTSRWLADRVMLDLSGQQLAATLTSLGMDFLDAVFVLERFYPHLVELQGEVSRAWLLMEAADPAECEARVEAWRRADNYTYRPAEPAEQPSPSTIAATPEQQNLSRQASVVRRMRANSRLFGRR